LKQQGEDRHKQRDKRQETRSHSKGENLTSTRFTGKAPNLTIKLHAGGGNLRRQEQKRSKKNHTKKRNPAVLGQGARPIDQRKRRRGPEKAKDRHRRKGNKREETPWEGANPESVQEKAQKKQKDRGGGETSEENKPVRKGKKKLTNGQHK